MVALWLPRILAVSLAHERWRGARHQAATAVQIAVGLLLLIVFWSIGKRFVLDMPNVVAGTMPEEDFDRRYVEYAWLAYLHIVPGAVYLFWRHCSSPTGSAAATTPSIDGSAGSLPLRA